MNSVSIEFEHRMSSDVTDFLLREILNGPLADRIAPVHLVEDDARDASALLVGEEFLPELFATRFEGGSICKQIMELAYRTSSEPIRAWCRVLAAFPVDCEPVVAPYLRFAIPQGDRIVRFEPLAMLTVQRRRVSLDFTMGGAPFISPPRVDRGGPIDQSWESAANRSRLWLERALRSLGSVRDLTVRVAERYERHARSQSPSIAGAEVEVVGERALTLLTL